MSFLRVTSEMWWMLGVDFFCPLLLIESLLYRAYRWIARAGFCEFVGLYGVDGFEIWKLTASE